MREVWQGYLVLSDMAPNKSGVDAVDLPRAMHLAELAMDFADHHLRTGGALLIKLVQGVGFDDYVRELRRRYDKVVIRKPAASRKRSNRKSVVEGTGRPVRVNVGGRRSIT